MALDPQEGLNASRQASARRAAMLLRLYQLGDTDGRQCLPTLIKACQCDTAMLAIRVWRVDQAVFGTGRTAALRHVRLAAQWCEHDLESPGKATVGWLLDETWLFCSSYACRFCRNDCTMYCGIMLCSNFQI